MIVGSILLAFAIDAGWANHLEQQRLAQLSISLAADIRQTQDAIHQRGEWAEDVVAGARRILHGIARGDTGAELDSVVFTVGNVFVKGMWAPINHTYEQALSTGDLSLIGAVELRSLLGRYSESLEFVDRIQASVQTQYYTELEPYMVDRTDYAEVAWDVQEAGLVRGLFSTDSEDLAARREFANLLNLKLELELEMLGGLRIADDLSNELLTMLESG